MEYDIIIIGGGPAGYPAAAQAVKQGLKTLLIEKEQLGGTCLNCGCIPTKSFCRSAEVAAEAKNAQLYGLEIDRVGVDLPAIIARKNRIVDELRQGVAASLKDVDVIAGTARFVGPRKIAVDGVEYSAPKILIATGAAPARLPIPGAEFCLDSTQILDYPRQEVPQSLVIIGGGVIGLEFASVFNALGSKVTVIEFCKEILPGFDKDIAKRLRTSLKNRGIDFILQAAATEVTDSRLDDQEDYSSDGRLDVNNPAAAGYTVRFEAKGKPGSVEGEQVLMAVGRKAVIPEGFEDVGGKIGRKGIEVDPVTFATSVDGVFAVGDCNGLCQLAHAATAQAMRVMGVDTDLTPIPAAVFTIPEAAMVGATEEQLKESGIPYRALKLPVRSNGKALTMGATDGLVKLLLSIPSEGESHQDNPQQAETTIQGEKIPSNPLDGKILGAHILGPHASDLIMEPSIAVSANLPPSTLLRAIHPHPTLSELLPSALGG